MRTQFVLLLSATVLCVNANISERYQKFINQHIFQRMSVDRCTSVIASRRIKTADNECKETNTFIRATTGLVKPICDHAGEPYGEMTKSTKPFDIVVCKLKGGRPGHCEYRGNSYTRKIAIRCEQGLPVHFDRDIVNFE
ncbi:angiogenin-like [Pundamilia nyererei]|uniref:Angiogenin-like n=1 Tax=Pundamilia nyererei TaxID=303518 RepID=A0A9Y3V8P1_9CICH|nr:PREDICTED: angiogenin-like [Pundamilia nyererei]